MHDPQRHRLATGKQHRVTPLFVGLRERNTHLRRLIFVMRKPRIDRLHVLFEDILLLFEALADKFFEKLCFAPARRPHKRTEKNVCKDGLRMEFFEHVLDRQTDHLNVFLGEHSLLVSGKFPADGVVDHHSPNFKIGQIMFKAMMIESNEHIHLFLGAANALVTDVQLVTAVPSFDQRHVLAIPKHAVAAALERLGEDLTDRDNPLTRCAYDFERNTIHSFETRIFPHSSIFFSCP